MVKYLGIRVVVAVILASYTAIDFTLNITGIFRLGSQWIPLVTFLAFLCVIFWTGYDLKRANEHLLDNRPTISVEPIKEGDVLYLKVHNKGAEGKFKTQIALSSPDDPNVWNLHHYNGIWKYGNKSEATILKDHEDYVKLAELISSSPPSPIISRDIRIWFFDDTANLANFRTTSSYFVGAKWITTDGGEKPIPKHKYQLEVVISSSPTLREDIYRNIYTITVDGFEDLVT